MVAPKVMDAYVRVSRVGTRDVGSDRYVTEKVQREACEAWAKRNGVTIGEVWLDRDQSGRTQQRPGLRALMKRIEAGETGGLVCFKLDRFARTVGGAYADLERIKKADAHLVCVGDGELIDTTTPGGKAMLGVMLVFAEFTLDTLKAGWRTTKREALSRNVKLSRAAFGYRAREDGTLEPDPETAPVVAEVFRRAAAGDAPGRIAVWLHTLDLRNPHRHPTTGKTGEPYTWTATTVRRLLARSDYRGEMQWSEQTVECPAIVDRATWTLAQPASPKGRTAPAEFPLSGLAVCSSCGSHMVGARMGVDAEGRGVRGYRCSASTGRRAMRGKSCAAPATMVADRLEVYVKNAAIMLMEAEGSYAVGGAPSAELAALEATALEAAAELEAFAGDADARRLLGEPAWRKALESRARAREATEAACREALEATRPQRQILPSMALLSMDAEPGDMAGVYAAMFEKIQVTRGRDRDMRKRVRIVTRQREAGAVLTEYLRKQYSGEVVKGAR